MPDEYEKITKLLLARRVLRGATCPYFARPHLLRMVSRMTRNHAGATASRHHVRCGQARHGIVAQQGVQLTSGTRRVFQAFSWLRVYTPLKPSPRSAHLQLTRAIGQSLLTPQRLKISKQGTCRLYGIAV